MEEKFTTEKALSLMLRNSFDTLAHQQALAEVVISKIASSEEEEEILLKDFGEKVVEISQLLKNNAYIHHGYIDLDSILPE